MTERINQIIKIRNQINQIFDSKLSWEAKFDEIFTVKNGFYPLGFSVDWADPDESFELDVKWYVEAMNEQLEKYLGDYIESGRVRKCSECGTLIIKD